MRYARPLASKTEVNKSFTPGSSNFNVQYLGEEIYSSVSFRSCSRSIYLSMFLMFDAYTIILLTGAANYIYVIYRLCYIQFMLFTNCKITYYKYRLNGFEILYIKKNVIIHIIN